MKSLAIDVGSTTVRAVVFDDDGKPVDESVGRLNGRVPEPGWVEYDPLEVARSALGAATEVCSRHRVDCVGIANQRGSTVLWDRETGEPAGPIIGWQDTRTAERCAELSADGLLALPNQAPTKAEWLWDRVDPSRARDLCVGTIDSWIAWRLSNGSIHISDHTNLSASGLHVVDGSEPATDLLTALSIPLEALPRAVSSGGEHGEAAELPGAPTIGALIGDQQASLVGHGCRSAGHAKLTFGSGLSLNAVVADDHEPSPVSGCFPIVAWTIGDDLTAGIEAIDLSGGSTLEWACELGLFDRPSDLVAAATACNDAAGVVAVPTLSGFGTPYWDLRATGAIYGLTRGSTKEHVAHALVRGVAFRAADLLDAASVELGGRLERPLLVDGGLAHDATFVRWVADACGEPVAVATDPEVTAGGAAMLAVAASGTGELPERSATTHRLVEPDADVGQEKWAEAVSRTRS